MICTPFSTIIASGLTRCWVWSGNPECLRAALASERGYVMMPPFAFRGFSGIEMPSLSLSDWSTVCEKMMVRLSSVVSE